MGAGGSFWGPQALLMLERQEYMAVYSFGLFGLLAIAGLSFFNRWR